MKAGESYWVADVIHRWRDEVGIEKRCDPEELASIFQKLRKPGARGLAIFAVLASEWLFRVKRAGRAEIVSVLGEVERGFRKILPHDLSNLMAEAVAPLIEKALRKEGRVLFSLSPFSEEAPELLHYPLDEPQRRKYSAHHQIKTRSGPVIWPAPWIAALATEKLIVETGLKSRSLALDLVNALSGRTATVDSNEFGKRRRRLEGEDLNQYCDRLKERHAFMINIATESKGGPETTLTQMLRSLGPASLFPLDDALIKRLLISSGESRVRAKRKVSAQPVS